MRVNARVRRRGESGEVKANCAPVSAPRPSRECHRGGALGARPARRAAGAVGAPPRTLETGKPLSAGRTGAPGTRAEWIH